MTTRNYGNRSKKMAEKESSLCQKVIKHMKDDPHISLLLNNIQLPPQFECKNCDNININEQNIKAYLLQYNNKEKPNKIILCTDSNSSSSHLKVALKHELIHAYDLSNKRYDFEDCHGLAHTEIRAAREADCNQHYFLFDFMKEACIIDKASSSTNSIYKGRGRECVKEVYDSAMRDNEPFVHNKEQLK